MKRALTYLLCGVALGSLGEFASGIVRASVTATGADGLALFRQVYEKATQNYF